MSFCILHDENIKLNYDLTFNCVFAILLIINSLLIIFLFKFKLYNISITL